MAGIHAIITHGLLQDEFFILTHGLTPSDVIAEIPTAIITADMTRTPTITADMTRTPGISTDVTRTPQIETDNSRN